jgi:hypothetical protein
MGRLRGRTLGTGAQTSVASRHQTSRPSAGTRDASSVPTSYVTRFAFNDISASQAMVHVEAWTLFSTAGEEQ